MPSPGTLFVVATPLGNLDDVSQRALETLRAVAAIACEDTRRTSKLLARYQISKPLFSCHRFNEHSRLEPVLTRLAAGEDIALLSDGGTPGIADPGALLVDAALEAGASVSPIPGPSAVATLLSVSGLQADRYVFEGFLPHRQGERRRRLRELRGEARPVVLFETPHRIREALADIESVLGARRLVLGRELTKLHETLLRGTAAELLENLPAEPRGEFALVLHGVDPVDGSGPESEDTAIAVWRVALEQSGGDRRGALRRAARELGLKRAELYRLLAELDELDEPGA